MRATHDPDSCLVYSLGETPRTSAGLFGFSLNLTSQENGSVNNNQFHVGGAIFSSDVCIQSRLQGGVTLSYAV